MLAGTRASFGIPSDSVRPLTRCLLRDPTLRGFAAAVKDARAGRLGADGDQQEIDFVGRGRARRQHPRAAAPRPGRGRTGATRARSCSPVRPGSSAPTCCGSCSPPPTRGSGAWSGRETRLTRCTASRRRRPAMSSRRRQKAASCRCPATSPQPGLGLSDAQFRDLGRALDIIYHPGALVNFIYPYQELRAANVAGTREVIRLAGEYRGIPVHYVSTTAVLAGLGVEGIREVTEETPLALPRAAAHGLCRDEVRRGRAAAERGPRGPSGGDLPAAGHRRQRRHRRVEHLDRDVRADQVHDRHRAGARHRPAA